MTIFMDSYNVYASALIFITAIQVCHYLLMNLTLAVLVQNLQNQKQKKFDKIINEKVEIQRQIKERKAQLNISEIEDEKKLHEQPCRFVSFLLTTFLICDPKQEPDAKRYDYGVIRFVWRMAIHPTFQAIFLLCTLFNLYVLSQVHFTGDKQEMTDTVNF